MKTATPAAPETPLAPETSLAVIGAGRLGTVLAAALRAAGVEIHGPFGRDQACPEVDVALICVPDAAIPNAAALVRSSAGLVGHMSGATALDDVDFSIHPLQTLTGTESPDLFHGIGCAIDGRTPEARAVAEQIANVLGARPFRVDGDQRAGYHAAASFASNFVLTVLDAAEQLALSAGIPADEARALLAPLVRRTVDNWTTAGAAHALTGPIARRDDATVRRQREAIADARPEVLALFDELCTSTRTLAERGRA